MRSPTRAADYDPTEPLSPRQAIDIDVGMRSPHHPIIPTAGETTVEANDLRVGESSTQAAGDVVTSQVSHDEPPPLRGEEDDMEDAGYDTDISDESVHAGVDLDEPGNVSASLDDIPQPAVEVPLPPRYNANAGGRVLRPRRSDWKSGPWQAR